MPEAKSSRKRLENAIDKLLMVLAAHETGADLESRIVPADRVADAARRVAKACRGIPGKDAQVIAAMCTSLIASFADELADATILQLALLDALRVATNEGDSGRVLRRVLEQYFPPDAVSKAAP